MALASSRVAVVRASWDTQEMLPYNRNAPRKIKKLELSSLFSTSTSTSTSTSQKKQTPKLQIDVDELLKFNPTPPRKGNKMLL